MPALPPGQNPNPGSFCGSGHRVAVPEGALMVWDPEMDMEIGVVVELGAAELAFEHFGRRLPMQEAGRLDLLSESGLYLSRIPYVLCASETVEEEQNPSPIPICRAMLRIGPLTAVQRTAVETLLSIYADAAAPAGTPSCRT
jgi:hypothetical protein